MYFFLGVVQLIEKGLNFGKSHGICILVVSLLFIIVTDFAAVPIFLKLKRSRLESRSHNIQYTCSFQITGLF